MGDYNRGNLVLSTELITWIGHRKKLKSWRFERYSFVRASGWTVGCVFLYAENWATLLVGIWWQEDKNKLVEWKALVDTVGIKSFAAFWTQPRCRERLQTAICCLEWLGGLKCDWFEYVLVISLNFCSKCIEMNAIYFDVLKLCF